MPPPHGLLQEDPGVHSENTEEDGWEEAEAGNAGHEPVLHDLDC